MAGVVKRVLGEKSLINVIDKELLTRIRFLSAKEATAIDEELMSTPGFSVDQLMELAGLAVAQAVSDFVPVEKSRRVLVFAGPGNNGGDGLVAARHLYHFGYSPTIVYPKQSSKPLFLNLVKQLQDLEISIQEEIPKVGDVDGSFDVVVDAVFGFSFSGGSLRAPFDQVVQCMIDTSVPVFSVDVPSGWNVDEGPPSDSPALLPQALISLTAPKKSVERFEGVHYLGGRFIPPKLAKTYGIEAAMDSYEGFNQIARLF